MIFRLLLTFPFFLFLLTSQTFANELDFNFTKSSHISIIQKVNCGNILHPGNWHGFNGATSSNFKLQGSKIGLQQFTCSISVSSNNSSVSTDFLVIPDFVMKDFTSGTGIAPVDITFSRLDFNQSNFNQYRLKYSVSINGMPYKSGLYYFEK